MPKNKSNKIKIKIFNKKAKNICLKYLLCQEIKHYLIKLPKLKKIKQKRGMIKEDYPNNKILLRKKIKKCWD